MVIISTSAEEVIIQAVSPEFSGSLVAANAPPAVSASVPRPASVASPAFFKLSILIFQSPFGRLWAFHGLKRVTIRFAGADTHDLLERRDENLSVADLACLRLRGNRVDHRVEHLALHCHFDFELGQETDGVFRAAIDFCVPLLPPVAFDLSHRHALNAEREKRFAHLVELEGFDDRRNKLHLPSFRVIASAGRRPGFNELSRSGPTSGRMAKSLGRNDFWRKVG